MLTIDNLSQTALPDHELQQIFDFSCHGLVPYSYNINVGLMSFPHRNGVPPAFCTGGSFWGTVAGNIFISNNTKSSLPTNELQWIILHELAHITNNDTTKDAGIKIAKFVSAFLLTHNTSKHVADGLHTIGGIKRLFSLITQGRSPDDALFAQRELRAD